MSETVLESKEAQQKTDFFMVWLAIAAASVVGLSYLLIHAKVIADNDRVGVWAVVAAIITLLAIFFQIVDAQRSSKEQKALLKAQSALMFQQNKILENQQETLNKQNELLTHQNIIIEYQGKELNNISWGINVRSHIKDAPSPPESFES